MERFDGTNIIAVGTLSSIGQVYISSNSGVTWTSVAIEVGVTSVYGLSLASSTVGMIAGNNGYVAKTSDGGSTWTTLSTAVYGVSSSSYETSLRNIYMIDTNNAFLVGCLTINSVRTCTLYSTEDFGVSWSIKQVD